MLSTKIVQHYLHTFGAYRTKELHHHLGVPSIQTPTRSVISMLVGGWVFLTDMDNLILDSQNKTDDEDDSGWDTDLGSDSSVENITFHVVLNNKERYKQACKECGVIPASYFLRNMTNQRLNMAHHGLGEKGAKAISIALMTNTHLTALNLSDNCLGAEGVSYICEMMVENCFVTELDLSENEIGFEGTEHICAMLSQIDSLKRLSLRSNSLGTKSAVLLAETLKDNTGLRYINLSDNCFGEEAGLHIAPAIALNEYLEEINLSWNHLRQKGAFSIAKSLRENITLKNLDLSWNGFGDDGIYVLSESLIVNGSLQQLNISSNRITHVGASHLQKGLKGNEGLNVIKIGNNPLQHGVLFLLQGIKSNPNSTINELDYTDIQVNNEFIDLLKTMKQNNPELKVYHGGLGGALQKAAGRPKPMKVLREYIKNNEMRVFDFFKSLDKDKSMSISISEFVSGLKETGVPLRHDELVTLVRSLDLDGDGEIDYKELVIGHKEMQREERDDKVKDKAAKERKKKLSQNLKPFSPISGLRVKKVPVVKTPSPVGWKSRPGSSQNSSTPPRPRAGSLPDVSSEDEDNPDGDKNLNKLRQLMTRRRSKSFTDGFHNASSTFLLAPSTAPTQKTLEEIPDEKPPKTS